MLAKKNRLSRLEVEFLLRKGVKNAFGDFLVIFKKNKARVNRFCIIISKKLRLKPVKRTRLRRIIYEATRKSLGSAGSGGRSPGATYDIALGPNSKIINKKFAELEEEITIILKNIYRWEKIS